MGTSEGSIIAAIITTHMPRKDAVAPVHVCPGIRIHGIGIPPIPDVDAHPMKVTAVLAANSSAATPKKACWEARGRSAGNVVAIMRVTSRPHSTPGGSQVVRMPGLQARPLSGGTLIGTGILLALEHYPSVVTAQEIHYASLWPAGRRVLPRLLAPVDGQVEQPVPQCVQHKVSPRRRRPFRRWLL